MTTVPNQLAEQYTFDVQDPNDPVWETDANIAGMQSTDDPNDQYIEKTPHVRTNKGALSFLNDFTEAVEDFLVHDEPVKPRPRQLEKIRTRELGADKWRGRTATVTEFTNSPMLVNSPNRRCVTLVNMGPNIAYVSSISSKAGAPNTFPLQVTTATLYAPMTLPTTDDIWLVCAATQTAVVSVAEFFDMES